VSHLRLVREEPARQRRKARAPVSRLSASEIHRVVVALKNYVRAMGSRRCAAEALNVDPMTVSVIMRRRKNPSAGFALRLAAAMSMTVEQLLTGRLAEAGTCPTCGSAPRTTH
jgi:DNA-binding XRE family transcriptional regulator